MYLHRGPGRIACGLVAVIGLLSPVAAAQDEGIPGITSHVPAAAHETTDQIMARQRMTPPRTTLRTKPEREPVLGETQPPDAPAVSQWPPRPAGKIRPQSSLAPLAPQTPGISFLGTTLSASGAVPPDTTGTVGPTQYVVFCNGRIRSFNKSTGAADGVLNADPDVFFASVMTPVVAPVLQTFTSDPRIKYDRFTGRWYLLIIDVPCTNAQCTTTASNRVLLAVSNASSSTITGGTTWTFFSFTPESGGAFCDYPTLGVDVNALYIGGNIFGNTFSTSGYVVQKSSILGAGPLVYTKFANLGTSAVAGPYTPQGADNDDPAATVGYFIGSDTTAFSRLQIRRVSNPGGASPTISGNITLTTPTTNNPIAVPQTGTAATVDALDRRLFQAHVKNGSLWTAANLQVNASGVASGTGGRNGSRWYQINNLSGTPALVQSGTVYDSAASSPLSYFIPSIRATGQGHAAIGFSSSGSAAHLNAATTGRLTSDALGTTQAIATLTSSASTYAVADGSTPHRWGDYSVTSLDPLDDMTLWTIQEFCNANNSWGVQVTKLIAPPPAAPASANPASVCAGASNVNVTITGTSSSGSGFYDPGSNLPAPALAFSHIAAAVSGTGVTVNSVTYTDATHVTLNVTVSAGAAAGARDVTITNPDSQTATGTGILTITAHPTTATVGGSKTLTCPFGTTTSLGGNTPSIGTGSWSVVGGGTGTFSPSAATPTATFTHTGGTGPITLRWTISNPPCTASTADVTVTITPDTTAPAVSAPSNLTIDQSICCGALGGVTSASSGTLASWLNSATATDVCTASPTMQTPLVGASDATTYCFESGTTAVTFRFKDASNNVGTAAANVTVRMYGDLNLDTAIDGSDMVVLRAYLNGVATPGVAPFTAPLELANTNHDINGVDGGDMVILRAFLNSAITCMAP